MSSKSSERSLPYFQQSNPKSCGAACLKMLYNHWGVDVPHEEIWNSVRDRSREANFYHCRSCLMAKDAIKRGCSAVVVTTDNPLDLIQSCHNNDIEVIVLYRPRDDGQTHFLLVVSYSPETYTVRANDPGRGARKGKNRKYTSGQFLYGLRRTGSDMPKPCTMILISRSDIPEYDFSGEHLFGIPPQTCVMNHRIFESARPFVSHIDCLDHDTWVPIPN